MDLFPPLKIGLLNGWILLAILYLIFSILLLIFPKNVVAELYRYDRSGLSKKQKVFNIIREVLGVVCLILIIFTPLKTRAIFFVPGTILFGLGLTGFVKALFDFKNREVNRPVLDGLYRVSRHPQILMLFISICGISITIGSLPVLLTHILASIFGHSRILLEEQACLDQFGDEYRAYMRRVPRYILFS